MPIFGTLAPRAREIWIWRPGSQGLSLTTQSVSHCHVNGKVPMSFVATPEPESTDVPKIPRTRSQTERVTERAVLFSSAGQIARASRLDLDRLDRDVVDSANLRLDQRRA